MCCYRGRGGGASSALSPSCWVNSFFCCGCFWSTTSKTVHWETITLSPTPFHLWPWKEWRRVCGEKWKKAGPQQFTNSSAGFGFDWHQSHHSSQVVPGADFANLWVPIKHNPGLCPIGFCCLFSYTFSVNSNQNCFLRAPRRHYIFVLVDSTLGNLGVRAVEFMHFCRSLKEKAPKRPVPDGIFQKRLLLLCVFVSLPSCLLLLVALPDVAVAEPAGTNVLWETRLWEATRFALI